MIYGDKVLEKFYNEIDKDVTIIIDEAAKFTPNKPKGIEILIRCSQEHKAEHKAAFKAKTSNGTEVEVYIKSGHGDKAKYGYYPVKNSDKKLKPKERNYLEKFAEKNAEIIDKLWDCKKDSDEYRQYMEELKENNKECKVRGDLGGKVKNE